MSRGGRRSDGVPRSSPRSRTISGWGSRSSRAGRGGRNALCRAITDALVADDHARLRARRERLRKRRRGFEIGDVRHHQRPPEHHRGQLVVLECAPPVAGLEPEAQLAAQIDVGDRLAVDERAEFPACAAPKRVTRRAERVAMRAILLASAPAQAGSLGYPRYVTLPSPCTHALMAARVRRDPAARARAARPRSL